MLDDLRRAAQSNDDDDVGVRVDTRAVDPGKLFGMTAVERMFLSIGLFGLVLVLSVMLLLVTGSVAP